MRLSLEVLEDRLTLSVAYTFSSENGKEVLS